MKVFKFMQQLETEGAKITKIKYRGHGLVSIGYDIELNGQKVEIEPQKRLGNVPQYFVRFNNGGGSQHYTKKTPFLPPLCKDMKHFKIDIINHLKGGKNAAI